jgi:hypothetical protein
LHTRSADSVLIAVEKASGHQVESFALFLGYYRKFVWKIQG